MRCGGDYYRLNYAMMLSSISFKGPFLSIIRSSKPGLSSSMTGNLLRLSEKHRYSLFSLVPFLLGYCTFRPSSPFPKWNMSLSAVVR